MIINIKTKKRKVQPKDKVVKLCKKDSKLKIKRIFDDEFVSALEELDLLHHIIDYSKDETIVMREDSTIVCLNDVAAEGIGYSIKYLKGRKLINFFDRKITQKDWTKQYISKIKRNKKPYVFLINRKTKEGKLDTLEITVACFSFKGDKHYISIGRNITNQVELLKNLRESESFYRQVCEQSVDAICTFSLEGRVIYANKAAEEMVKSKLSPNRSTHFLKYIKTDSEAKVKKLFKRIKSGEKVAFEKVNIVDKKGKEITIEITSFPVYKDGKVSQIHCIFRDIGKRVQVENLLLESQKMKASQLFISGTTQEIQNPLKGLLSMSQSLIDKYGERSFEYIGYNEFKNIIQTLITMRDQIKYCFDTSKRLIDISKRKVKMHKGSCDVNSVIRETVKMFEHELKVLDISFKLQLASKLPEISMNRVDFNQIFVNIFTNAIQSMLVGKKITVRTKFLKKENMVRIECIDQGVGISKDILPRVFEPFFTTKQRGLKKNAGLGLSIVYSIVDAAKGNIQIISNENRGTTVQINLPV